jgi:peptidoglycan/xylan/chitin deacetylase (PgdA/CDA1 family)
MSDTGGPSSRAATRARSAAAAPFLAALEKAAAENRRVDFWWRDDDAERMTQALNRLLALARTRNLPLALAVIPADVEKALADRIAREPNVSVLQHGWRHLRHNPPGAKKAEFGDDRPLDAMLAEIDAGTARLHALFGNRLLPGFVPPWNRIGARLAERLADRGLVLSAHSPGAPSRAYIDTHCDIIAWRTTRSALPAVEAFALLADEVELRLSGQSHGPVGLLTHHLVHDEAAWQLLDDILAAIASSPASQWRDPKTLFSRGTAQDRLL